jgi:DNA-binding NarL/FixJ family response regulator
VVVSVDGVAWLLDEAPDLATFVAPGWVVRALDEGPHGARRTLLVGTVTDAESAGAALESAAMGVGLAIHVALAGSARQQFLEDLNRLGVVVQEGTPDPPRPTDEQVALLELLMSGATVTAAAAALHVSRRTTNRMLGEIRELFGVDSNALAVKVWAARAAGHR